ncbi:histone-lysine N-methyltransferase 2C-like isoform X4 [Histomonas meleagridis]|uniref:histone-lysine N-methyltransferase 2C-like isoform X4 n=1 Tax=Histomonas meleagridis TaxID=135588 RepID=UPI00355A20A7|nr:histone-lysine N-methyltransferase 2C-like isoform X4 [Histomonas meleagridis]KAH0798886.1 histone-lysine N-methyltransferase 2C-like isoform X4 [Histomonas meleagridis]
MSVCPGCASKCAVCGASGATHNGVKACRNCYKAKNLGMKCPVCGKSRGNSTMGRLCSRCSSKRRANHCDFCGGKI